MLFGQASTRCCALAVLWSLCGVVLLRPWFPWKHAVVRTLLAYQSSDLRAEVDWLPEASFGREAELILPSTRYCPPVCLLSWYGSSKEKVSCDG